MKIAKKILLDTLYNVYPTIDKIEWTESEYYTTMTAYLLGQQWHWLKINSVCK